MPERPEMTPFNNWFNIHDQYHLKAYGTLIKTGVWPPHFIPADVVMDEGWEQNLRMRICLEYIKTKTYSGTRRFPEPSC